MVVSSEVVHYDKDGAVVTIGWSGALDWMEECFCFSQRQTRPIKCSMAPFPFENSVRSKVAHFLVEFPVHLAVELLRKNCFAALTICTP